jgi:NAD(P)-dependent dehydrogenase (short-subunit alcohol dehydrogenase family)
MAGYAALVTGGGRGIGRGIALALAEAGFAVAVNDLVAGEELHRTLAELRASGVTAVAVIGDVGDLEAHGRMLDEAEAAVGPLTTLVNNAGVTVMRRGDLLEASPESFDRCVRINTRGPFFLTQAWAKRAIVRDAPAGCHRAVITVTSANAVAVALPRGEYCVSKAGAAMVAKLFAVRLGPHDICSYEIRPGIIETDMTAPVMETYRDRIAAGLTLTPRAGTAGDIGRLARALATGELAYCTGEALHADGGLLVSRF